MNYLFFALLSLSSVAFADYQSFFLSFNPKVNASKAQVKDSIRSFIRNGGNYLTLGETHLEQETVHVLQQEFIEAFLEAKGDRPFNFCSETIVEWLNSDFGKILRKQAKLFKHFPGTGFDKCAEADADLYLNYAGDFHLFPYARGFALEFSPDPVLDRDDLNIHAQMKGLKGLFIPQFELAYLEGQAAGALLHEKLLDQSEFRRKAAALIQQSQLIRESMSEVLKGSDNFSNKFGILLPRSAFTSNVYLPSDLEFYFFITNRGYQSMAYAHHFLQKLLKLSPEALSKLLQAGARDSFYTNATFSKMITGQAYQLNYPGLPFLLDGEAQILKLGTLKVFSQPDVKNLECYDGEEEMVAVDCEVALKAI